MSNANLIIPEVVERTAAAHLWGLSASQEWEPLIQLSG